MCEGKRGQLFYMLSGRQTQTWLNSG